MTSPALIIRKFLLDEALGTAANTFVAFMPDAPDLCICVYDVMGRPDGRMMRGGERIEHPGIQIVVRGKTYLEAWKKANAICLALDGVYHTNVQVENKNHDLINVSRPNPMNPLGVEADNDKRRHRIVVGAFLTLHQEVSGITVDMENITVDDETITVDE